MIRVLVADDHAVVREGIKRILADTPDLVVAGEASDRQEILAQLAAQRWDVVLLDISLPGGNGLEILQHLKRLHPQLRVLVFSVHGESQYAVRAFKAGAAGYLTKHSPPEELVTAIRRVVGGGRYISPSLAEQLAFEVTLEPQQPRHAALSNREFQVLQLLASGRTVAAVAAELSLSVKTISTYRARILEKLQLQTTAELIHYAVRHGLVD
jgi:DNA-binding NarL/FixJ family response regulator